MRILYERCCGLDVHQNKIVACVMVTKEGEVEVRKREFSAYLKALRDLRFWLPAQKVTLHHSIGELQAFAGSAGA